MHPFKHWQPFHAKLLSCPITNIMPTVAQNAPLQASMQGPKHSHTKHSMAYGQPLVKCPPNIGKSFPPSLLTVNDTHSRYGAWSSSNNTIGSVGPNDGVERVGVQNDTMLMDILQLHHWQLQQSQNQQQLFK
ncbi:hypothetical protein VNO77_18568 [Canavalia gladiata]|uniref:Uncharacterized protein n=1 Tax=Canavalia gladiata TaxID=3824 RepID=A0AAN9LPJ4_CANGL